MTKASRRGFAPLFCLLLINGVAAAQTPQVTPALLTELDTVVPAALRTFDVPGAGVAVIQNGQVVYAKGFGVRNVITGAPFTPDTAFRIGSTTKSMTAMLAATQVDRGLFSWDTPVAQLSSAIRLPSAELTRSVTVRQTMGMGTGIGENPLEVYADLYSPAYLLRSLPGLPVVAPPSTKFFYNNSIFSLGGYVGALKQGVETPNLLRNYTNEMRRRLFVPIGMATTAVTDDPSTLSDNFSVSYGYHLPSGVAPTYLLPFEPIRALAPAGAVCTTLNDMARYLVTQLRQGIAPNGTRVVSAANLTETWKGQTPMGGGAAYAMGWIELKTPTFRLLTHEGSADGFRTDMTLLPDAGVGMLIFANSDAGSAFLPAIRSYIFDRLTKPTSTAIETAATAYQKSKQELEALRASVRSFQVTSAAAAPLLGQYEKGWRVEYTTADQTLWLTRRSGYRLSLLPTANGYLIGSGEEYAGFGMTVRFAANAAGTMVMTILKGTEIVDTLPRLSRNADTADALTREAVRAALPKLNSLTLDAMSRTGVPGVAIGVVYRDEVVYIKGFGVRQAGNPAPVTEDTVFQLASMSKPIASTVVSAIVSTGAAHWDDPVVKYDPAFRLADPWVTQQVTIEDLFAHRSGLYANAGNDIEGFGYSRDEILRRLQLLAPGGAFRAQYGYSNFGLTEGGIAAAKAAGKSWEQVSAELIYQPLGMTSTSSRYEDFRARENRASLHVPVNGQWTALLTRNADAQSPAGGVSSNVRDLMEWVRLELSNGKYNGIPLITPEALGAARRPLMIRGANPDTGAPAFYGLGWNVDYEKNGELRLSHAGAFTVGTRSLVTLLPADGLGIVVLSNAFPTGLPEAVTESFLEQVRGTTSGKDWLTIWDARYQAILPPVSGPGAPYATPPAHKSPPLPLSAYVGTYRNAYVGDLQVVMQDGNLRLLIGPARKPFTLEHWDRDNFVYSPSAELPAFRAGVFFQIGPDQTADQITLEDLNGAGQGTLTRIRPQ